MKVIVKIPIFVNCFRLINEMLKFSSPQNSSLSSRSVGWGGKFF